MKKILTNFFIFYIGVGSLVALPMSFSYIYAEWFVMINLGWSIFSLVFQPKLYQSLKLLSLWLIISSCSTFHFSLCSLFFYFDDSRLVPSGYRQEQKTLSPPPLRGPHLQYLPNRGVRLELEWGNICFSFELNPRVKILVILPCLSNFGTYTRLSPEFI